MTASTRAATGSRTLLMPLLLIVVGVGWLLTTLGVTPSINWIWTLGLAVAGFLPFALHGFDKLTVTVGPFFLIASLLSVLRQTGQLNIDHEMPILVILAGVLLLVARSPLIPVPQWSVESNPSSLESP
ncbi:hypothetical protein SH528x_004513 [Novipirellula sp. SH528]|uniref:hypothetical protein n=1 Tax=Novipirellula sp. SH528 TaxID=3454466 RepID=UPI003FA07780